MDYATWANWNRGTITKATGFRFLWRFSYFRYEYETGTVQWAIIGIFGRWSPTISIRRLGKATR